MTRFAVGSARTLFCGYASFFALRRRRCAAPVLLLCAAAAAGFSLYWAAHNRFICFNLEHQGELNRLCRQWSHGRIHGEYGGLCHALCYVGTEDDDRSRVEVDSCQAMHFIKKMVLSARWGDRAVVLKAEERLDYVPKSAEWDSEGIPELARRLTRSVRRYLGVSLDQKQIVETFAGSADNQTSSALRAWLTLRSREAVKFRILDREGLQLGPKILGICGNVYAEEMLSPIPHRSALTAPAPAILAPGTGDRVRELRVALGLIGLERKLERGIRNSSLVFCDIKVGQFALTTTVDRVESAVRIIDGSDIFDRKKKERSQPARPCSNDEMCKHMICHGSCNLDKHSCEPWLWTSNLQKICSKVFLDSPTMWTRSLKRGLLEGAAAADGRLRRAVMDCASGPAQWATAAQPDAAAVSAWEAKTRSDLEATIAEHIRRLESNQ